ncbi:MAG: DUF4124 domain-containing protein [Archangium sp.]
MMRLKLISLMTLLAAPAFAQQGVWTGYVNGWQYTPQPVVRVPLAPSPYYSRRVNPTAVAISQLAAQQAYFNQMNLVERQKENSRREADELTARRIALEQQERAFAEQREQQAWYAAEEQRRIAESERKIAEAKAQEAEAARRELEFTRTQLEQKKLEETLAQREKEIAAREAERMKQPQTPGPKLYKWVDADGVTHLSTLPPR